MWVPEPDCSNVTITAAFHVGLPLHSILPPKLNSFPAFAERLAWRLNHRRSTIRYERVSVAHEPETRCPLGEPVFFRRSQLDDVLRLTPLLTSVGATEDSGPVENVICVFPSGIILVIVRLPTAPGRTREELKYVKQVVEEQYCNLALIFLEVAKDILSLVYGPHVPPFMQSKERISSILSLAHLLQERGAQTMLDIVAQADNVQAASALESLLIDVYYVLHTCPKVDVERVQIGYVDSHLISTSAETFYTGLENSDSAFMNKIRYCG